MQHTLSALLVAVMVCGAVIAVPTAVYSQGLENYALVHLFGLSSATTTRQFGMGGTISCVWDEGFSNPAFAAAQSRPNASARVSVTNFSNGPELIGRHAHYVHPLRENKTGLQLSVFSLNSRNGEMMIPGVGPATTRLSEDAIAVHFGGTLAEGWKAGISVTPHSRITVGTDLPGGVPLMDIEAKADMGARIGFAHEWGPGSYLGLVYDNYQETATGTGMAFGGAEVESTFRSELIALGGSYQANPNLLGALEYCHARSYNRDTEVSHSSWRMGMEYRPGAHVAFRAGLNGGRGTGGVGFESDRLRMDYTFMDRWNDDASGPQFGGSSTHQVQVIYGW